MTRLFLGNRQLYPVQRVCSSLQYQVVVGVFGAQHGGHLPQVGGVVLLVHAGQEGDGDDPLSDVDQVQLVALVQRLQQTQAPAGGRQDLHLSGRSLCNCRVHSLRWIQIHVWLQQIARS